jgi:hypothetical protein
LIRRIGDLGTETSSRQRISLEMRTKGRVESTED